MADAQTLREIAERVGFAILDAMGETDYEDLNSAAGTLLAFQGPDDPQVKNIARILGDVLNALLNARGDRIPTLAEKQKRIVDMIGDGIVAGMTATPPRDYPS